MLLMEINTIKPSGNQVTQVKKPSVTNINPTSKCLFKIPVETATAAATKKASKREIITRGTQICP